MNDVTIEIMSENYIDYVLDLETRQNIHILSKENILNDLKYDNYYYFILKLHDSIIGYIAISIAVDEADILAIVIDINYQNKGYGTYLINFIKKFLKDKNIKYLFLEVRKTNIKAQKLYEKCNFVLINKRKNYYADTHETAYIYRIEL